MREKKETGYQGQKSKRYAKVATTFLIRNWFFLRDDASRLHFKQKTEMPLVLKKKHEASNTVEKALQQRKHLPSLFIFEMFATGKFVCNFKTYYTTKWLATSEISYNQPSTAFK